METHSKTMCSKLFGRQLPVVLLLGSIGACPVDAQAESDGGTNNAKSSPSAVVRDPFWPVGYQPESGAAATGARKTPKGSVDWSKAMKQVVINGVSSRAGGGYVAIINNEVKSVGEAFSIRYGGVLYTWKVASIKPPGSVKLRRVVAE